MDDEWIKGINEIPTKTGGREKKEVHQQESVFIREKTGEASKLRERNWQMERKLL